MTLPSHRFQPELRCAVSLIKSPTRRHRAIADLPERLATLTDPRDPRGKRHPFVSVLLVACSAVVTGARSFVAIGQWARNAPQDTLARLGARTATVSGIRAAPSGATVRRLINHTCPGGLADLLGHDPAALARSPSTARPRATPDPVTVPPRTCSPRSRTPDRRSPS
ncbi:transposase family protein [Streptomyces kaempferi]